jgi:hypothetical protein
MEASGESAVLPPTDEETYRKSAGLLIRSLLQPLKETQVKSTNHLIQEWPFSASVGGRVAIPLLFPAPPSSPPLWAAERRRAAGAAVRPTQICPRRSLFLDTKETHS